MRPKVEDEKTALPSTFSQMLRVRSFTLSAKATTSPALCQTFSTEISVWAQKKQRSYLLLFFRRDRYRTSSSINPATLIPTATVSPSPSRISPFGKLAAVCSNNLKVRCGFYISAPKVTQLIHFNRIACDLREAVSKGKPCREARKSTYPYESAFSLLDLSRVSSA